MRLEALQVMWLAEQREFQSRAATAQAVEYEPVRLRDELHDGLGPTVGAVILKLQACANLAAATPGDSRGLVDEAQADLRRLVDQIRTIVRGLRPPLLDELGLHGALERLVATQQSSGAAIDLRIAGVDETLPAAVETAVFRIVAEALENVRRHAEASAVEVRLELECDAGARQCVLALTIRDNGSGFDQGIAQTDGVGLLHRAVGRGGHVAPGRTNPDS